MSEDLFYTMDRGRLGIAVIINNLDKEQTPTRRDVEVMGKVLKDIGEIKHLSIVTKLQIV